MLSTLIQGFGPDVHAVLLIVLGVWAGTIGLPVPEEVPLLSAGWLAAIGVLPLPWAIAIGFVACLSGDIAVFGVGRRIGLGLQGHSYLRRLMRGRYLLRARHLYLKRGRSTLFMARLLPGLKMPFLFTAGAFRMPWGRFLLRDVGSLCVLVPGLVVLAYSSGLSIGQLAGMVHRAALVGIGVAAALVFGAWWLARAARRRRQIWRSRCVSAGIPVRASVRVANLPTDWS